jgi:nitrate/nitrite transporter NarK
MLASATLLTHTALQLPGGLAADRLGLKRALGLGMGLAALGIAASSIASNTAFLLTCRLFVGIGTAISFISALAFVNGVAPARRRQVVQGLYGAASNLGVLLVMVLSGPLALLAGWRGGFLVEGALLFLVVAMLVTRLRSDVHFAHQASAPWREVFSHRYLYLLGLAHIVTYGAFTGISSWAVTFLWERHTIGLEWAGMLAAFMPASSLVARTVGGGLAIGRERQVILLSCSVTAAGIAALSVAPGPVAALVALAVVGWFSAMPFGAIFSYAGLIGGRRSSGRDLSLVNFIGNLGALAFPTAIGYALDLTGSFVAGFGLVAAAGLLTALTVALWLPRPGE